MRGDPCPRAPFIGSLGLVAAVLAMAGCLPAGWAPDPVPTRTEVEPPTLLASDLDGPTSIAAWNGSWFVLEAGGSRLLQLTEDGGATVLIEGLEAASDLASSGVSGAVAETGAGRILEIDGSGQSTELFADVTSAPTRVIPTVAGWAWIGTRNDGADGALWSYASSSGAVATVATGLSDPRGLAETASGLAVGDEGAEPGVFRIDSDGSEPELVAEIDEEVRDLAVADGDRIVFTGLAERWPGGGWVYGVGTDGSDLAALSYSPPGLGRVAVSGSWVYWASKEAITRAPLDGGTYEVLAHETRVGGFVVSDDRLVWTDSDRDEVLTIDLP